MTRSSLIRVVTVAALLSAAALPALAQKPSINLNVSTPGARANAMGGAFIGVADDATAAVTNPAGLVSLTKPQAYIEFSSRNFEPFVGTETRLNSLSFLALSMPINSKVAVGVMRNQFLNYDDKDLQFKGDSIGGSVSAAVSPTVRVGVTVSADRLHQPVECDVDCTHWGVSFVVGVLAKPNDQLSVGVAVTKGSDHEESFGFNTPNRVGGGVGYRPTSRLLVAIDGNWIQSSNILPGVGLEDVTEVHAGGEYLLLGGANQLFVRAGGYATSKEEKSNPDVPPVPATAGTVGLGYTVGQRFQTDIAYVSAGNAVIVSGAFRFR